MANLKEIQKRIKSVKNTEQITRAMYMISAARLRKAQDAAESARPYSESLSALISNIVSSVKNASHPLLVEREEIKKAEIMVFTSDRGLCGGFNTNLIKKAVAFMEENAGNFETIDISTVGKKVADYFKRRKVDVRKKTTNLVKEVGYSLASQLADDLTDRYVSGEVDAVYLIYPVFQSALTQVPTVVQILPFEIEVNDEDAESAVDYIYEPDGAKILDTLLPRQIRTQVYSAMVEAVASEHGSRMTAMDSASTNAADMIDALTLKFNRARQAAITGELMEIISGAEALKG
jgi:F-type H+-transporting ATPase subunit gamma